MVRPGALDPDGPGEMFVAQWRLRTDELQGYFDPGLGITSDNKRSVALYFSLDGIYSFWDGYVVATFEPGLFHDFELRSSSMLTYDLYLDGAAVFTGSFGGPEVNASRVSWGDYIIGGASLARWDYFRFGVVPEVNTAWMALMLVLGGRARARG